MHGSKRDVENTTRAHSDAGHASHTYDHGVGDRAISEKEGEIKNNFKKRYY